MPPIGQWPAAVMLTTAKHQPVQASSCTPDIVAGDALHHDALLSCCNASYTVCVVPSHGHALARLKTVQPATFVDDSMLWAFGAHRRAQAQSKIALCTFGLQSPERDAGAMPSCGRRGALALALSKTLFMEQRTSSAGALDIWPALPVDAGVRAPAGRNACTVLILSHLDARLGAGHSVWRPHGRLSRCASHAY